MDRISGPAFLVLYGICLVAPLVIGAVWIFAATRFAAGFRPALDGPLPTVYHVAFLQAGRERAVATAIGRLLRREHLRMSGTGHMHVAGRAEVGDPLERAVLDVARGPAGADAREVIRIVRTAPAARAIRRDLERHGLLVADRGKVVAVHAVFLLYLAVLIFGLARWVNGAARHLPVGYLTLLVFVALCLTIAALAVARRPHRSTRTERGKRALRDELALLGEGDRKLVRGGLSAYPDSTVAELLVPARRRTARRARTGGAAGLVAGWWLSGGGGGSACGGGAGCAGGGGCGGSGGSGGGGCGGGS